MKREKTEELWKWVRQLIFPPRCPGCDCLVEQEGFCPSCSGKIRAVREPVCKKCGKQITGTQKEYCYDCTRKKHNFTQGKGMYLYEGPMKKCMYRLKYSNRRCYGRVLAKDAVKVYGRWIRQCQVEALVPVPMFYRKQQERGYNQAKVLAKEIGRLMKLPVASGLIVRQKNTIPQKGLSDGKRQSNLKNAFKITGSGLQLKKILIIDDIYTTGSTVDAVAAAFREAGVREIYVLCMCVGKGY